MKTYIRITRFPYEEPYHLNLVIAASNGSMSGGLEFHLNADDLVAWAEAFKSFPIHATSVYLWEAGSERTEDRFAYYLRLRLFTTYSLGHSALQIRWNNNLELPDREIFEMCIQAEPAQFNRLGMLLCYFEKLKHKVLYWSPTEGELFETMEQAEQCIPADALRRG